MQAECAPAIRRPPPLDGPADCRQRVKPECKLGGLEADEKSCAAREALIGVDEQTLRRQVHRAVPDETAIAASHATAQPYGAPHFAAAVGRQMAARGAH